MSDEATTDLDRHQFRQRRTLNTRTADLNFFTFATLSAFFSEESIDLRFFEVLVLPTCVL